jgi:hypothetical protein
MTLDTISKVCIVVDYTKSLQDMIAAGRYDWVHDITPKRFPIKGTGIVEFETKVFHLHRFISSDDAVAAIKADDKTYGAKADEQHQYPIIGLGSVAEVRGDRRVPCLGRGGAERSLDLAWWDGGWLDVVRFLAETVLGRLDLGLPHLDLWLRFSRSVCSPADRH